jgi:hypothetical protein
MAKSDVKRGQWWRNDKGYQVRVLAVFDTYAAVRRPRAMPFIVSLRDFQNYTQLSIATGATHES